MARERDFPASRNRGVESATSWILAMLALGVVAALLVVAVVPADNGSNGSSDGTSGTEHVIPNTPPPVRTE
jgi:hypothetical protein